MQRLVRLRLLTKYDVCSRWRWFCWVLAGLSIAWALACTSGPSVTRFGGGVWDNPHMLPIVLGPAASNATMTLMYHNQIGCPRVPALSIGSVLVTTHDRAFFLFRMHTPTTGTLFAYHNQRWYRESLTKRASSAPLLCW